MAAVHPQAQWFPDAKLGMFIHWGPYSLRGIEASWPLQPHNSQHISVAEYESLATEFNPDHYEPREWARVVKDAGAKYVVLTAKHHDGYCLFDTKTTDYCATKTGPGRDLVGPYVEAMRDAGLKVGLYFTTIDWHDPDFATIPIAAHIQSPKPYQYNPIRWYSFHQRFMEQLRELLTNYGRIDLIWFDVPGFGADRWRSHEVKQMMLNLQPHLVINDRLPDVGDYETPEQFIPHIPPEDWWETCMTLNHQWAYHPEDSTYKSAQVLVRTLTEVIHKGGNLLLNVGPQPSGALPQTALDRLIQLGGWLEKNGEAIYGTCRPPVGAATCYYGPMSRKGRTVYLHMLDIPQAPLELRGVVGNVTNVRLVSTGEPLTFRVEREQRIQIDLQPQQCDPWNTVVAVDFEDSPMWP